LRIESGSFGFDANFKTFLLMREITAAILTFPEKVIVDNVKYNVERSYHFIYAKKLITFTT
jgi:hypothetical protein